jgi:hypothetical protein
MIPVEPDGTRVMTVLSTVAGITDWLRADSQLVATDPMELVISKGVDPTTVVVEVAKGAVNKDPGCAAKPAKPTCFPILTDPAHWGMEPGGSRRRTAPATTVGPDTNRHLPAGGVEGPLLVGGRLVLTVISHSSVVPGELSPGHVRPRAWEKLLSDSITYTRAPADIAQR